MFFLLKTHWKFQDEHGCCKGKLLSGPLRWEAKLSKVSVKSAVNRVDVRLRCEKPGQALTWPTSLPYSPDFSFPVSLSTTRVSCFWPTRPRASPSHAAPTLRSTSTAQCYLLRLNNIRAEEALRQWEGCLPWEGDKGGVTLSFIPVQAHWLPCLRVTVSVLRYGPPFFRRNANVHAMWCTTRGFRSVSCCLSLVDCIFFAQKMLFIWEMLLNRRWTGNEILSPALSIQYHHRRGLSL